MGERLRSGRRRRKTGTDHCFQIHRKKACFGFLIGILTAAAIFGYSRFNSMAEEPKRPDIYYSSILIEPGDTLWSIAGEYYKNTDMSVREYLETLKQINGLKQDHIHAGRYLTVLTMAAQP